MSLPTELLAQARHLARKEPRRPRDASLRRAVSAAYYALFHLLTSEASRALISGSERDGLRALVARGFAHADMSRASKAFSSGHGGLPPQLRSLVGQPQDFPADLARIAATFHELQQIRHTADYDTAYRLTRGEVLAIVDAAERAFTDWRQVRNTEAARVYLVALLMWERWRRG
jgi:uncharacterized protein (UPF0332 family)